VAVVGAGLAGALLATLLGRRGIEVSVYERRPDPRVAGAERGRSINLAISTRGLDALQRVGLADQALARALPMHGRMIHTGSGAPSFRPYSAGRAKAINSIGRAELNRMLLDAAEATPGVTLHFGHRLRRVDLATGQLTLQTGAGPRRPRADVVLACDGAHSAARQAVIARPGTNYSQDYLDHGYRELTIPARSGGPPADPSGGTPACGGVAGGGEFALDPDALHIWPRGESMMIALPNLDRSFTCTLFWPAADFAALDTPAKITAHFREHYPDAVPLLPTLVEDYLANPLGSLVTVRCWPWVHGGERCTLALVGDAAHAIVPFYGQGANCALEDCIEIDTCLAECGGDWQQALAAYEQRRKANCDAIADMALANFVEMRERVTSPVFRATSAATHALERGLGGRYASRYELVSFSTTPYAQIDGRLRRQNRLVAAPAAGLALLAGALAAVRRLRRGRHSGEIAS
jgi:kynurenine 3-monooxygenase